MTEPAVDRDLWPTWRGGSNWYRLAIVASHPGKYEAPLYRRLAAHPSVDLTVFFCHDIGLREQIDPGFGVTFKWDIPVGEGYRWRLLPNWSPWPTIERPLGSISPSVVPLLASGGYDAVLVLGYNKVTFWLSFLTCWLRACPLFLRGDSELITPRSAP